MNNITDEELEEMHTLTTMHVAQSIELHLSTYEGFVELENDSNFTTRIESAKCINNLLTLTLANGQVFSVTVVLVADDPSKRVEEKEGFRKFCEEAETLDKLTEDK